MPLAVSVFSFSLQLLVLQPLPYWSVHPNWVAEMMGFEQPIANLFVFLLVSNSGQKWLFELRAEMGVLHYLWILFLHITSDPFCKVNWGLAFFKLTAGNWPLCSRYVRKGLDEEQIKRENGNDLALPVMPRHFVKWSQIPWCSHVGHGTYKIVSL